MNSAQFCVLLVSFIVVAVLFSLALIRRVLRPIPPRGSVVIVFTRKFAEKAIRKKLSDDEWETIRRRFFDDGGQLSAEDEFLEIVREVSGVPECEGSDDADIDCEDSDDEDFQ